MKKPFIYYGWILLFILGNPSIYFSQKRLGQTVVTANSGVSPMGMFASMGANGNTSNDVFRAGPVLVSHTDVGLTEHLSIGPSVSYQSFRYYYDAQIDQASVRIKDVTTRANFGGRFLYHNGSDDDDADDYKKDTYVGIRVGYTSWKFESSHPAHPYSVSNQPWGLRVPIKANRYFHVAGQIVFGGRYYFSRFVGMNFEIGIGGPAFFSAGVSSKFF